jgi:hypothetical protein
MYVLFLNFPPIYRRGMHLEGLKKKYTYMRNEEDR